MHIGHTVPARNTALDLLVKSASEGALIKVVPQAKGRSMAEHLSGQLASRPPFLDIFCRGYLMPFPTFEICYFILFFFFPLSLHLRLIFFRCPSFLVSFRLPASSSRSLFGGHHTLVCLLGDLFLFLRLLFFSSLGLNLLLRPRIASFDGNAHLAQDVDASCFRYSIFNFFFSLLAASHSLHPSNILVLSKWGHSAPFDFSFSKQVGWRLLSIYSPLLPFFARILITLCMFFQLFYFFSSDSLRPFPLRLCL